MQSIHKIHYEDPNCKINVSELPTAVILQVYILYTIWAYMLQLYLQYRPTHSADKLQAYTPYRPTCNNHDYNIALYPQPTCY